MTKLLYRMDEGKAALGCGTTKIYELIAAGRLEVRKLGRRTYITADSLERFVESLPRHVTPAMKARRAKLQGAPRLEPPLEPWEDKGAAP